MEIHATAQVHPDAQIADGVEIGPFSVIGEHVQIGAGTVIANNATIIGRTTIGEGNRIFPFAVLGADPQDLTYQDETTYLRIGDRNTIREFVTMNTGTVKGGGETALGSDSLIMAYCHIAHDCLLGDRIVMANGCNLGGHVKIEDRVVLGGLVAIHHFVTVGTMAFIGGLSRIVQDVPPYMITEGNPSSVRSVNLVGLKRNGLTDDEVGAIKQAYRLVYRGSLTTNEAIEALQNQAPGPTEHVAYLIEFLRNREAGHRGRALEAFRKPAP